MIVIGAGGHARVLLDLLNVAQKKVLGVTDMKPDQVDRSKLKVPLLGTDEVIFKHKPDEIMLVNGIGTVEVDPRRANIFKQFKEKSYRFATLIHPSAIIAGDVQIEEGAQIMAGVIIQTGSRIGQNAIINTRVSIDHDCIIGDHAHLAPGVVLSGSVVIGEGCHLGTGVVVTQLASINSHTFIKAASLVTRKSVRQFQS